MESNATLGSQTPEEHEERQAALDRGEPFLLFRDGDGRQRIVPLNEDADAVTIGRRFEADISLPWDPEASRLHAGIRAERFHAARRDGALTGGDWRRRSGRGGWRLLGHAWGWRSRSVVPLGIVLQQ